MAQRNHRLARASQASMACAVATLAAACTMNADSLRAEQRTRVDTDTPIRQQAVTRPKLPTPNESGTLFTSEKAENVLTLDPDAAARLAASHSPGVVVAATDVSQKAVDLEAARLYWRPTLSAQILAQYGRGESTSFQAVQRVDEPGVPSGFSEGTYNLNIVNLSLPLYAKGAVFNQDTPTAVQAEGKYAMAESYRDVQSITVANQVVKAYFSAALAKEQRAVYQEVYAARLEELEIVRQRVTAQVSPKSDQLLLEAALASADAGVNTATSLFKVNLIQLRSLLGLSLAQQLELAEVRQAPPAPLALPALIEEAVEHHPQVRSQLAAIQVANGELLQIRGEYKPSLTFNVLYHAANSMRSTTNLNFLAAGVTLIVPLTDFGQGDAKIRAKSYDVIEARQKLELLRNGVTQGVAMAYHALVAANEQISPLQKKLEQFRYAEQVTRAKYELGQAALDKLIDDQSNVLEAQLGLLNGKYSAWLAYADLVAAVGKPYSSRAIIASR